MRQKMLIIFYSASSSPYYGLTLSRPDPVPVKKIEICVKILIYCFILIVIFEKNFEKFPRKTVLSSLEVFRF